MNIIFFGSSKYSTIVEEALFKKFGLSLVVSLPDRPSGRKKNLAPNPVKSFALEKGVPVITTEKLDAGTIKRIAGFKPSFLVVSDYGLIMPKELLDLPKYAPLNVHHSLLPKYRGPSPAPSAILAGDEVSGVTIIKMTEKVDAGDIIVQEKYRLKPEETTDSLLSQLNALGGRIIIPVIENYTEMVKKAIRQEESKATHAKRLARENGFIDIINPPPPEVFERMVRAYHPWPGVWTRVKFKAPPPTPTGGFKLKIVKFLPGEKIQVEGGKPMTVRDFLNGYPEAGQQIKRLWENAN